MAICILLATWNGAPYLRTLLDSLQRQTVEDWQLLVRDDGSDDETVAILTDAATDRRIRILSDTRGRQGPAHNFGLLMSAALATDVDYVAFADQDDLWIPEKLERQLDRMRDAEALYGRELPLLVHTDLTIVDEALRVLHPSFMRWSGFPVGPDASVARLLIRNHVVGCTMLSNRRLLELALPAPREMVMHDWWLGMLAAVSGGLVYDDEPSVLYRQHANNQVGAASLSRKFRSGLGNWRPAWNRALRNFSNGVNQARALRGRLYERAFRGAPMRNSSSIIATYVIGGQTPSRISGACINWESGNRAASVRGRSRRACWRGAVIRIKT